MSKKIFVAVVLFLLVVAICLLIAAGIVGCQDMDQRRDACILRGYDVVRPIEEHWWCVDTTGHRMPLRLSDNPDEWFPQ